jgi:HEPN domain-containing protein
MRLRESRIKEIEEYIKFLEQTEGNAGNMPVLEKVADFDERVRSAKYWWYIDSADYHYFVARALFLRMVFDYSCFSGHQCIENYLKAYLKFCNRNAPSTDHILPKLLERCRSAAGQTPEFIAGNFIGLIVRRFDPYYEVGRYPVQHIRPRTGTHCSTFPDDIFILDYFVYQMRLILPVPENTWDMFREGKNGGHWQLYDCMTKFPDFYNLLKVDNINFMKSLDQVEQHEENG